MPHKKTALIATALLFGAAYFIYKKNAGTSISSSGFTTPGGIQNGTSVADQYPTQAQEQDLAAQTAASQLSAKTAEDVAATNANAAKDVANTNASATETAATINAAGNALGGLF